MTTGCDLVGNPHDQERRKVTALLLESLGPPWAKAALSSWRKQPGFWFSPWPKALGVSLTEEYLTGSRTVYIQHVIRMSFPHYVWGLTAIGTIIRFVQIIDEQIGPRQYGMLRHFIIDSHPSHHHGPVRKEEKDRSHYYFPLRWLRQTSHPPTHEMNHMQGDTIKEVSLEMV